MTIGAGIPPSTGQGSTRQSKRRVARPAGSIAVSGPGAGPSCQAIAIAVMACLCRAAGS
ncbi:MAG: hypothetical protein KGI51_11730 [Rhodospirillales bacterium]|nr:hypothetical protein [Rhodospirillales bacterium]